MGEYIRLQGVGHYKLGTCEDLYYVRFEDLREWIAAGRAEHMSGNLLPREYAGGEFRFRFPFVDEDGAEEKRLEAYANEHWRGLIVPVPPDFEWAKEHASISHWLGVMPAASWKPGDAPSAWAHIGLNAFFACPWGSDADKGMFSPIPERSVIKLYQQRPIEGQLWAVVGCPFCAALWRLPPDAAAAWVAFLRAGHPQFAELARRIEAGYVPGAGVLGV